MAKIQDSKAEAARKQAEDAAKAQDAAPAPESKVAAHTSDGTAIDGKSLVNQGKAEGTHPDTAPAEEVDGPTPVDRDAPHAVKGDGETAPKDGMERRQQEAFPVPGITSEAAPLDAPEDAPKQSDAVTLGLGSGDLNDIAVGVGLRSSNGERSGGLVDENGEPLEFEDSLDYGDGTRTTVVVTKRVYETFYLPGSQRPLTRLMYGEGATISRETAAKVVAASKA